MHDRQVINILQIKQIFKSYEKENKKVLMIGRTHMKKFVAKVGLQSADCFYVKDRYAL